MTTPNTWEERFENTQLITKAGCWLECSDYEGTVEDIKSFIASEISLAVQEERERIHDLITKEINIARSENESTSRLTSLWVKVQELKSNQK